MFVDGGYTKTTNPLTILAVIEWLEKQPADQNYVYSDTRSCLAAQYNESIARFYEPPSKLWQFIPYRFCSFDAKLEKIAFASGYRFAHTFALALQRARSW